MKRRRIAAVVVGLALVVAALNIVAGSAIATSAHATCSVQTDNHWPAYTQGRPAGIDPHTTSAIYMWHDSGNWHIRVTHRTNNLRSFSGQLSTAGTFAGIHAVHLEKSDQFQVSKDRHAITFLFKNYGAIDGVDFSTHCAPSIKFALQSDGHTSPPSKIVIGHGATHPAVDPFEISRVPNTTTTTSIGDHHDVGLPGRHRRPVAVVGAGPAQRRPEPHVDDLHVALRRLAHPGDSPRHEPRVVQRAADDRGIVHEDARR